MLEHLNIEFFLRLFIWSSIGIWVIIPIVQIKVVVVVYVVVVYVEILRFHKFRFAGFRGWRFSDEERTRKAKLERGAR